MRTPMRDGAADEDGRTMRRMFLTWVPYSSRSALLAQAFGAPLVSIGYLAKKTLPQTLARYCVAACHTLFLLCRHRPAVVFVMNQPVFLPMMVCAYARVSGAHYVIDSHSGLFQKRVWRTFLPLMKGVYRRCALNLAHNEHDAARFRSWGVRTMMLATEIYRYDAHAPRRLETVNNIVVIGKLGENEPVEEVVAAAAGCVDANFYITGPRERAQRRLDTHDLPHNVTLTGFLPRDDFLGLVKAADVALVLVTTDHTMQMGAWEAMACGTPLVLSDWPLLRATFPKGAVFVQNRRQSIENGIRQALRDRASLAQELAELRNEKRAEWDQEINAIEAVLRSDD